MRLILRAGGAPRGQRVDPLRAPPQRKPRARGADGREVGTANRVGHQPEDRPPREDLAVLAAQTTQHLRVLRAHVGLVSGASEAAAVLGEMGARVTEDIRGGLQSHLAGGVVVESSVDGLEALDEGLGVPLAAEAMETENVVGTEGGRILGHVLAV